MSFLMTRLVMLGLIPGMVVLGRGAELPYSTDFEASRYEANVSINGQDGWVNLAGDPNDSRIIADPTGGAGGQVLSLANGAGTQQYFTNTLQPLEEDIVISYRVYGASASHVRDRTVWFSVNDNADVTHLIANISIDSAGHFTLNDTNPVAGIQPLAETWYTVTLRIKRASQTLDLTITDSVTTGVLMDIPYYQESVTNQVGKIGFHSGVYDSDAVIYVDDVSVSLGPAPAAALIFTNFETEPGPYLLNESIFGQHGWVVLAGGTANSRIINDPTGSGRGQLLELSQGGGTQRYFATTLEPVHHDVVISYQVCGAVAAHTRDRTSWFWVNDNAAVTKLMASISIDGAGRFVLNDTHPVPGVLPQIGTWYSVTLVLRRATQTLDLTITDGNNRGELSGVPYYQASTTNQLGKIGFYSGVYDPNAVAYVDNVSVAGTYHPFPLPLAGHWTTGVYEEARGWEPANQLHLLLEEGHHLLPWFQMPQPDDWEPPGTSLIRADFVRNQGAFASCRDNQVPISLIATEWDAIFSAPGFRNLPVSDNPNLVTVDGHILDESDPFGPVEQWREAGRQWTSSTDMQALQALYPNPPLVVFVTNNERARVDWRNVETSLRYVQQYGLGRDDAFKRKVVADGWIERFRAFQEGMKEGLTSPTWKQNARFIGYDAFGPPFVGRWPAWKDYSLYSPGRLNPDPLMWDGAAPSYYTDNWNESTDFRVFSPQIESMNWVFQLRDAWKVNPRFWFELSIWDGYTGGTSLPPTPDDKRAYYQSLGQVYTPTRYRGYLQFGMWLLRPRVVREFRMHIHPWEDGEPYFRALLAAVDQVHENPVLRSWWREGVLVPNTSRKHPYQEQFPAEYAHEDRWFLLDADCNPSGSLTLSAEIPVYALALTKGKVPAREWLVYAHSPLEHRSDVTLTIPQFGDITVDVAVGGSFYLVKERENTVELVNEETGLLPLESVVSRASHGPAGTLDISLAKDGSGVEPRALSAVRLVFTFAENLVNGEVSVKAGQAELAESPEVSGRALVVRLTGLADQQKVTLGLLNILSEQGKNFSGDFSFSLLCGDVDGNGVVDSADRESIQRRLGQNTLAVSVRDDVNMSGGLSAADIMCVQQRLGRNVVQ